MLARYSKTVSSGGVPAKNLPEVSATHVPASLNPRNQSLDVLRGIAILQVIAYHFRIPGVVLAGQLGVNLFFVLSGFLISGLLFSDYQRYGVIRLRRFWMRRAFKILPPVYFFLATMLFILRNRQPLPLRGFISSALFCFNYFPGWGPLEHIWSLSVEEQFYIVLPLLLLGLIRWSREPFRSLPWIFVGIAGLTFGFRIFNANPTLTHLRADALFTGVMLRYLYNFKLDWFRRVSRYAFIPGLLFWLPAVLMGFSRSNLVHSLLYTWIDLGCGCLLAWCFAHDAQKFWRLIPLKGLAFLGFYSYSIYLWQQPLVHRS